MGHPASVLRTWALPRTEALNRRSAALFRAGLIDEAVVNEHPRPHGEDVERCTLLDAAPRIRDSGIGIDREDDAAFLVRGKLHVNLERIGGITAPQTRARSHDLAGLVGKRIDGGPAPHLSRHHEQGEDDSRHSILPVG